MNKIEIELPVGKEVDWETSAKQKQIVLKDKQLTYKDICNKLFKGGHYYTDEDGNLRFNDICANTCPNNATTRHQLECIIAKNKLANVARYLNGEWKWELGYDAFLIMDRSSRNNEIDLDITAYCRFPDRTNVLFKSYEAAQQAIKILGEETIKLALEPLY
jgi:hypothetical protein